MYIASPLWYRGDHRRYTSQDTPGIRCMRVVERGVSVYTRRYETIQVETMDFDEKQPTYVINTK